MTDKEQKIPRGRLGRLARMARAGAGAGLSMLRSRDSQTDAEKAAAVLGQLRGLATKLGQMASYVDGVIPTEHRDAYEQGMAKLRAATPRSSAEEIQRCLEEELGAPVEELFADWDPNPMASASIGQVHRATLHDGRQVAVKVQHPGIAEALEADLKNATVMNMASKMVGMGKFEPGRLLEEAAKRFREELDYSLEARHQNMFRALHEGDPEIVIPEIIASHSATRVLTSELISGVSFEDAALAPPELRARWAGVLWRFVFKGILVGGVFNADPHPGNYLFYEDGRVGFLDFGCVQMLPEYRRCASLRLHKAALAGDEFNFDAGARTMLHLQGGRYEELALAYARQCLRPITETPFCITRDYAASLVDHMKSMTMELRGRHDAHYVAMPEGFLFINRLQFGFYSVLARLNAEVDYAKVEHAYITLAEGGRHSAVAALMTDPAG